MPLENLEPVLELSEGARLLAPKFPVTFVEGTPTAFTVQAEDGVTQQTYYVTPKYDANVKGKGTTLFTDTIQIQNEDMACLLYTSVVNESVKENTSLYSARNNPG